MGRWLSQQDGCSYPLSNPPVLILCARAAPTGLGMEVMAPPTINALNGSSVKLSCTFNSCYKVENKQFSLNWTYQECWNCSEELVSPAGDLLRGPGTSWKQSHAFCGVQSLLLVFAPALQPSSTTGKVSNCLCKEPAVRDAAGQAGVTGRGAVRRPRPWPPWWPELSRDHAGCGAGSGVTMQCGVHPGQCVLSGDAWLGRGCAWGAKRCLTSSPVRASQFLQFRTKIMNKQLDRFGNRVEFTGNPTKYDVSFTLKNVQLEDEGTYNCYVLNPPDRQRGHASINLKVLTQGQWQSRPLCRQAPMGAAPCPDFPLLHSRRVCSPVLGASPACSLLLPLAAPSGGCLP